jgi:hypothetical protein
LADMLMLLKFGETHDNRRHGSILLLNSSLVK